LSKGMILLQIEPPPVPVGVLAPDEAEHSQIDTSRLGSPSGEQPPEFTSWNQSRIDQIAVSLSYVRVSRSYGLQLTGRQTVVLFRSAAQQRRGIEAAFAWICQQAILDAIHRVAGVYDRVIHQRSLLRRHGFRRVLKSRDDERHPPSA